MLKAGCVNAVFIVLDKNFCPRFIFLWYLCRVQNNEDISSFSVSHQTNTSALSELDVGRSVTTFTLSLVAKWQHKFEQGLKVACERNYSGECFSNLLSEHCEISFESRDSRISRESISRMQQYKQPVIAK
jgi:hypothetical protein